MSVNLDLDIDEEAYNFAVAYAKENEISLSDAINELLRSTERMLTFQSEDHMA